MNLFKHGPPAVPAMELQSGNIIFMERKGKRLRIVTATREFSIFTEQSRQIARLLAGNKMQQVHKNYWVSFPRIISFSLQNKYLLLHRRLADQSGQLSIPYDASLTRRHLNKLLLDLLINPRFN